MFSMIDGLSMIWKGKGTYVSAFFSFFNCNGTVLICYFLHSYWSTRYECRITKLQNYSYDVFSIYVRTRPVRNSPVRKCEELLVMWHTHEYDWLIQTLKHSPHSHVIRSDHWAKSIRPRDKNWPNNFCHIWILNYDFKFQISGVVNSIHNV